MRFILFLSVFYMVFQISVDAKEKKHSTSNKTGYCPFGICMGMDPADLFKSKEYAKTQLMKEPEFVQDFPLKYNYEWITSFFTKPNDRYFERAKFSSDSGICALAIDIVLNGEDGQLIDKKQNDFVNETKKYLYSEIGSKASKTDQFDDRIVLYWSGNALNSLKNVYEIILNYSKGSVHETIQTSIVTLIYKFDNYTDCD